MTQLRKWFPRVSVCLALAVVLIGVLRVRSTLLVFSSTVDEPDHIANGMEWLSRGTYTYEPKHTPLGRVANALPLWLDGSRSVGLVDPWDEGNAVFASRGQFRADLAKARSGTIVFFILMCGVVFLWSRELFGPWIGLICLLELSLLPAVLALSGLVTTDMAGASTFLLSLWMFLRWSRQRTIGRAIAAGLCLGLALLAKLSAVPFLVGSAMVWLVFQWWMRRSWPAEAVRFSVRQILLIALSAFVLVWAGYRFQSEPLSRAATVRNYQARLNQESLTGRLISKALDIPIPGGNMIRGFGDLLLMEQGPTIDQYFLGEVKRGGWPLYFPIAFSVKAPLPFLLLAGISLVLTVGLLLRREEIEACYPAAFALVVFLICLPTHWNVGTRYLLALYPLFCIASGLAIRTAWRSRRFPVANRVALGGLYVWLAAESAYAHPDYQAYFNELAGSHPEKILVEGDLEWGQDLYRLKDEADRLHAYPLWEAITSMTPPGDYGIDSCKLPEEGTVTGWVAVSIRKLVFYPERFAWLAPYPWHQVGKTIRLYHVNNTQPLTTPPPSRSEALTILHLR